MLALGAFILLALNLALGPLKNHGVTVAEGSLNARKALAMIGFMLSGLSLGGTTNTDICLCLFLCGLVSMNDCD